MMSSGTETADNMANEQLPFVSQETGGNLALYEEDISTRPRITSIIRSISSYNPTVPSATDQDGTLPPGAKLDKKAAKPKQSAKMGTFMGVYLPCLQNIFGVLFFIRLAWIVGTAGILQAFFVALICCAVTFLTSISLSAIATNGFVPGGGPYFMISRNLGPELGGAVGILFYLGTTVAASMYITGAVEIFLYYLVPAAKLFAMENCFRLYGTGFLLLLSFIVMAGMRVVNKFALPGVIVVLLCIVFTFVGIFVNAGGSKKLQFCMVGDRPVNMLQWKDDHPGFADVECNGTSLEAIYCNNETNKCDSYFERARNQSRIRLEDAITGFMSGVSKNNTPSKYLEESQIMTEDPKEHPEKVTDQTSEFSKYYVAADMTTSFLILIGVFFPSVTGIMAGSNRSGDLKDASRSIPLGTIAATVTTSVCYLAGAVLFGASVHEMFIRDKVGASANGKLVIAELAIPHPKLIEIGCFLSTLGAALQSLTGAPRLLQAIAKDGVIPLLRPFQESTRFGEPFRAQLLTFAICELGILIAVLESLTALITQFFLMCYLSTNAACALQSLLRAPGWRPRFRYYHWSLSTIGAVLCFAVMFMSHWWFAIIAILIGVVVYKYIEYRGAEKEWGDGIKGLALSTARYALLKVEEGPPHTKNWRPQILVLCNNYPDMEVKHTKLLAFTSQLKAGRGLTVLASVLEGDIAERRSDALKAKESLARARDKLKMKGFCEVLVGADTVESISALIQTSGLGGLKHNTVIISWPSTWRTKPNPLKVNILVETVRKCTATSCALLVLKNIDKFPDNLDRMSGKIDVWWVVHDGGLLLLLGFLLKQHRTWRGCRLRLFTIAQMDDNSIKMKEDLVQFLYQLRINAEVEVIEMHDKDIHAYAYERTLVMEQRNRALRQLRSSDRLKEIQSVVDYHHGTSPEETHDELELRSPISESTAIPSIDEEEDSVASVPSVDELAKENGGVANSLEPPKVPKSQKPHSPKHVRISESEAQTSKPKTKPNEYNVRRMHTAIKLNELMQRKSCDAQLLIINLPAPPKLRDSDEDYMEFVDVLTNKIDRVVLVRGGGSEVVTIYS